MRVEDLKNNIEAAIKSQLGYYAEVKQFLDKSKMVITITKGEKIIIKVIEVQPTTVKKEPIEVISKEVVEKVKVIKKAVKINTDVSYLLALLEDVEKAAQKLDYKHLTDDAAITIKEGFDKVTNILQKTQLLEYKP